MKTNERAKQLIKAAIKVLGASDYSGPPLPEDWKKHAFVFCVKTPKDLPTIHALQGLCEFFGGHLEIMTDSQIHQGNYEFMATKKKMSEEELKIYLQPSYDAYHSSPGL
jgi:hypothetical protein